MQRQFEQQLNWGQIGEGLIANWFKRRGFMVLPVYEKEIDNGKGPRLFTPETQLIAPDILIFKTGDNGGIPQTYWIEAKRKTGFTWYRKTSQFTTGIDIKHYNDYCQIDDITPFPVWLLFLHEGGQAKDSPQSPSGLFGGMLNALRKNEHHRWPPPGSGNMNNNYGKGGMVYWSIDSLKKIAELHDVILQEEGK